MFYSEMTDYLMEAVEGFVARFPWQRLVRFYPETHDLLLHRVWPHIPENINLYKTFSPFEFHYQLLNAYISAVK